MKNNIHKSWFPVMGDLYSDYSKIKMLFDEILPNISYQPSAKDIFRVFSMPVKDIKVVILGNEPNPLPGVSNGLAFGRNREFSKSLIHDVLRKEIIRTTYWSLVKTSDFVTLQEWEKQGVFLLNLSLTVETTVSGSHQQYWLDFSRKIIQFISSRNPCIWLLWGDKVQSFNSLISRPFHVKGYTDETIKLLPNSDDYNYILSAQHPVIEEEFLGCKHFKFVNEILSLRQKDLINW